MNTFRIIFSKFVTEKFFRKTQIIITLFIPDEQKETLNVALNSVTHTN